MSPAQLPRLTVLIPALIVAVGIPWSGATLGQQTPNDWENEAVFERGKHGAPEPYRSTASRPRPCAMLSGSSR